MIDTSFISKASKLNILPEGQFLFLHLRTNLRGILIRFSSGE